MADPGAVRAYLGTLPADQKLAFTRIFEDVLASIRIGRPGHQKRAANLQWYQLDGTTPTVAETEFSMVRFKGVSAKARKVYAGVEPLTAEDVAETMLSLIETNRFVTGEIVVVDGGFSSVT